MIRKRLDVEKIRNRLQLAHEEGFDLGGFFILGFPTETKAEMEERIEKSVREFLKKADVVTGDELKALKKEIRDLKKTISQEPDGPSA